MWWASAYIDFEIKLKYQELHLVFLKPYCRFLRRLYVSSLVLVLYWSAGIFYCIVLTCQYRKTFHDSYAYFRLELVKSAFVRRSLPLPMTYTRKSGIYPVFHLSLAIKSRTYLCQTISATRFPKTYTGPILMTARIFWIHWKLTYNLFQILTMNLELKGKHLVITLILTRAMRKFILHYIFLSKRAGILVRQ